MPLDTWNLKPEIKKLDFNYSDLLTKILNVNLEHFYKQTDFSLHNGHDYIFTKFIVEEFMNIQATNIARFVTEQERLKLQAKKNKKKPTKLLIFKVAANQIISFAWRSFSKVYKTAKL